MPNVEAVIAKYEAESAGAEAAVDNPSAPPAGASTAASAPAGVEAPAGHGSPASPGATIDHEALQAKLDRDRDTRAAKENRRRSKADAEAAAKTKAEADAELAKWKALGKDKPWLDAVKAAGHDPRKVFEEMQKEALTAGTPAAEIAKLKADFDERLAKLDAENKSLREEREAEKAAAAKASSEQQFSKDFQRAIADKRFASLLEEYEPDALFGIAAGLRDDPRRLFSFAKKLNVSLTSANGTFSMLDIFNVLNAAQADHRSKVQRRNQSAAPHTSQAPVTQEPEANPTVNGTAARKADPPTTIGNDLATSQASERERLKGMSREDRVEYLKKKYPNNR